MIRPTDRVSQVLARDGRLIEVFAAASPAFERLRNPALRKVMTRLVTVEQAARIAGVDAAVLVGRLNATLAEAGDADLSVAEDAPPPNSRTADHERRSMPVQDASRPAALAAVPASHVVDLDVREDLRNGREPFRRIMAARHALPAGGVLRLRAIFEPVPLYHVMAKQGFDHWTEQLAADDWRVWFFPAAPECDVQSAECEVAPATPSEVGAGDDVVVLDVRGLEPPEPMVRTLAALEQLPRGKTLLQINIRTPQFLLPRLEEQGFNYEIREQSEDLVRVFIRHA